MGVAGSKTLRALTKEGRLAGEKFDDVELHVISLTYKDLAGLSKENKGGEAIDKATFLQNFPIPGLVGDRLFHALDSNKTGRISFDDFVVGLSVCCRGSHEERMRLLFGVYDMNEDGLIGRDELLLMLNQVPRTLLNIGIDPVNNDPTLSPTSDWSSLTLEADTKTKDASGGVPPTMVTPRARRLSASGGATPDLFGRDGVPPPLPSARGRGAANEKWSKEEGGPTPAREGRLRSTLTNERIADQALEDFGSGAGEPLTFEQFQRWAQSTPALQALLKGAFPSDAHFSLATSPTARRSTCESLTRPFESPRRSTPTLYFGTPNSSRESKSAATAISAVAAWSASASVARPASARNSAGAGAGAGRGGTPKRQLSLGGDLALSPPSRMSDSSTAAGARVMPSRTLSRNTSYDNLLRSPLVGQGVGAPLPFSASSPVPKRLERSGSFGEAGLGGGGDASAARRKVWKWGKMWDDDEFEKDGGGGGGSSATAAAVAVGAAPQPGTTAGIWRDKDKDRDMPPTPLTAGRTNRRVPPSASVTSSGPRSRGGSSRAALTAPDPLSNGGHARSSRQHTSGSSSSSSSSGGGGGGAGGVDDTTTAAPATPAAAASKQLAATVAASTGADAGSSSGSSSSSSNDGNVGAPPKTPSKSRRLNSANKISPPGTTDMTRKARKLAMMAAAAETAAVSNPGGEGTQPGTLDLLALANAAAAGEKPPARVPRRGKLMRYLSQDGGSLSERAIGSSGGGGTTPSRARRLMRMGSHAGEPAAQGGPAAAAAGAAARTSSTSISSSRIKIAFRRSLSLSAGEHKKRGQSALNAGSGRDPKNVGIPAASLEASGGGSTSGSDTTATAAVDAAADAGASTREAQQPKTALSPRGQASETGKPFNGSHYAEGGASLRSTPNAAAGRSSGSTRGNAVALGNGASGGGAKATTAATNGHTRTDSTGGGHNRTESSGGGVGGSTVAARAPPSMPTAVVLPSADVSLGLPHPNVSPLLKAEGGVFALATGGTKRQQQEKEVAEASAGAEAVVRDCLYNSHGMVALDGYLWKPGSIRLVRRWMMLVDNTLYYFVKPGDNKPRGVLSLPGCIAEAVDDDKARAVDDPAAQDPRKSRVPTGYYGLRLLRPNNHGKDSTSRLFLAKSAQERDEWVAELRVASRVVPLEDIFELKGLLRKGAFASVHRCVRKDTKEEYAVKVIDKTSLSTHERFLLRGEIGALKLVSHPNVVRLEAVHEDPRSIAIVMTLCRGGDLWDKVRSQPSRCFNTTQARTVMRPLCEAVLYLHTLGILHRDIKPENILLVDDGAGNLGGVTLSDFGFSHQVSPKSRLACGKQLMGTPSYMAPESILHGMYGKEVDWFSCGCVLYMMLMGRAPFAGNNPSEIFRNTCHGRLGLGRGGASLWDRLPSASRELIVGLMQLDHNLRFTGEQALNHRWLSTQHEVEKEERGRLTSAAASSSSSSASNNGDRLLRRLSGQGGGGKEGPGRRPRQEGGGGGGGGSSSSNRSSSNNRSGGRRSSRSRSRSRSRSGGGGGGGGGGSGSGERGSVKGIR